jgi:uncharacterized protein (UPF0332 family)
MTKETKEQIVRYRGLALGLFQSISIPPDCNEYDVRNGFSRLYYAFFHASLALLLSRNIDIEVIRKNHGLVHSAVDKQLGRYFGRFVRELYAARLQADYEPNIMVDKYHSQIERARFDANSLLDRARPNFTWIQQESKKVL